ncbi:MAG: tRNA (adenosine(37)-N6)-threonylcarbamoyltransferase complex dimerization subunit type 1 TsaB [Burkholderiaceae bacterium]
MTNAPILLALDTATDVCSVALAIGGEIVESSETVGHAHSARLLPMIDALLAQRGLRLADCDAIAFGAGPGSFTGLRIACSVAQGLAWGAGKRVIPVGNLAALARGVFDLHPAVVRTVAAVDARMHEAYCAVYERRDGACVELAPPALATAAALVALVDRWRPDAVAGDALTAFPELAGQLATGRRLPALRASAAAIAAIALDAWRTGRTVAPREAAPLYVRDRVALTVEERRAARATP